MHFFISTSSRLAVVLAAVTVVLAAFSRSSSSDKLALDTGAHKYVAPGPNDSRSPCPALNVLSNHGYLPRDGKKITPFKLIPALQEVYGLSAPLAHLLSLGGFFLLHQHPMESIEHLKPLSKDYFDPDVLLHALASLHSLAHNAVVYRSLDLHQIGAHNHIEHDASITHDDIPILNDLYASSANNETLFGTFLADSVSQTHISAADIGRARARRERESHQLTGRMIDRLHADIARGEAALVVSIFGEPAQGKGIEQEPWDGPGVPFETVRTFWRNERLPVGWHPVRETSIGSIKNGKERILASMKKSNDDYMAAIATKNATIVSVLVGPQVILAP